MPIIPRKLEPGDEIRVIAPSMSLALISHDNCRRARSTLEEFGFRVGFGRHVETSDIFMSSSIEERVADLHDAFADRSVAAVLTVIGGYNCNQLLPHIDYDLVSRNPKVFCGYSDITALQNAFLARADLVTYSGPHFSTFAMAKGLDFTQAAFMRCLATTEPFELPTSEAWSDDPWYEDQDRRIFHDNGGLLVLQAGRDEGRLVGGNLSTLNLLQGTPFMPPLDRAVLVVEEDELAGGETAQEFDRNLESLLQLPEAANLQAILIGRFQQRSRMTADKLRHIVGAKPALKSVPVVAELDVGHTTPHLTLPIGARVRVEAMSEPPVITLLEH